MEPGRFFRTWDGLCLHIREWGGGGKVPILGLPGLVRTGGDFASLGERYGAERRLVSLDYIGRGASSWARSATRYAPEATLRDILDTCAALHLHRAVVIGTSFGGLLAMALAAVRPGLLAAVVLNDIGPDIAATGAANVHRFVADDPALPNLDEAADHLQRLLPNLSFSTPDEWRAFASLTYLAGPDGRLHPRWDRRIAGLLGGPLPDLWQLFGALAPVPLMLVHGGRSDILAPDTVARMRAARPDMHLVTVPRSGHAPTLDEPEVVAALADFLP